MDKSSMHSTFQKMARLGYGSRGLIYLVIGGMALLAAFGEGGGTTGSKGALREILQQPFGVVMLVVLVFGLLAYSTWRTVQSVKDVDHHGTSLKGLAIRAGLLVSALTHILLAVWAISLLTGNGDTSSQMQGESTWINGLPGQVFLGLAALAVIGAGLAHIHKGWTAGFERFVNFPPDKQQWAHQVSRFGLVARGVVWSIIGWFLIKSAMMGSRGDIHGVGEALDQLRDAPYGPWLLALVAAGLFAFGAYSVLEGLYRRIDASS